MNKSILCARHNGTDHIREALGEAAKICLWADATDLEDKEGGQLPVKF